MAKKKTIDLRSVDPTPVPAGDVNIIYNGVRIGGFSEDTEAVLKTGGCRVEHDINVNYNKPGNSIGAAITCLDTSNKTWMCGAFSTPEIAHSTPCYPGTNNEFICYTAALPDNTAPIAIIPAIDNGNYVYGLFIAPDDADDILTISVNNTTLAWDNDNRDYRYVYTSSEYPSDITITISNKSED